MVQPRRNKKTSQKRSDQELNWPTIEKEAFAVVSFVQKCRRYLLGNRFTILIELEGVSYFFDSKLRSSNKNSKLCWWRLVLSEYDCDILYRKGKLKVVVVAMSRVSASCLQLDETCYDAIGEEKNKEKNTISQVKQTPSSRQFTTNWAIPE